MNHDKKVVKLENIYLEVQARYLKTADGFKKEWFGHFNNQNTKYNNVIVSFAHIDQDNPEFFLQPGQVVKVLEGEMREEKKESSSQFFLDVVTFRQTDDEEKNKINHI
ncbi:Conserved hypothetical protein [Candidatus Phytoplasma australiense]|uniref:Uncharacterized protein n=2 Tax=Phytoplasma australiense TaxID=59748 RepID=B1VA36_PHYAS|nr:hypothetical protein [Candidatus Phytoplasma australiense]AGL90181.1 hypothetical protein SLY_0258 [Strawberry lethal yellows phytoplasma (CPA) str. NZSb11]CAM11809.1 Conserved hypothetical protein [Candidatus Phytoplasma australiense]